MLNETSLQAVDASRLNAHFRKPLVESYNFAKIPAAVQHLLTGEETLGLPADVLGSYPHQVDKVIFLFVDAFGWSFFQRNAERHPFLRRFLEEGVASKITSQFPSTTTAHVTTIHLGQPVNQTGIYEWFYYEPLLDRLIAPLMFSYAGDKQRGTIRLPDSVGSLKPFFPDPTLYERLAAAGVKSYVFQDYEYASGGFSNLAFAGAKTVGYKSFSEASLRLGDALAEPGKAYYFFYYPTIDTIGHDYGPDSREFDAEIAFFADMAERLIHQPLVGKGRRTLLLLSADHGQGTVSPERTIYLNQQVPELIPLLRTDGEGRLLVPAGSARDLFLYVKEDRVEEAYQLLSAHPALQGRAQVMKTADLNAAGVFGPGTASDAFLMRVAPLVVLPYAGETVWWYEKGRFEMGFRGHHGGLTPQEVDIPLLAYYYD